MNRGRTSDVLLRASAREAFIPLAVSFAEKAALGLGLEKDEASFVSNPGNQARRHRPASPDAPLTLVRPSPITPGQKAMH